MRYLQSAGGTRSAELAEAAAFEVVMVMAQNLAHVIIEGLFQAKIRDRKCFQEEGRPAGK